MSQDERDELADRLQEHFDERTWPRSERQQVFWGIGYIMSEADPEVAEALDLLSDKVKEL